MPLDKRLERKFRRTYGADLLPVGMTDYVLGDIVEWDGFIKKQMDFEQINLINKLKIAPEKKAELFSRLSQVPLQKASFQQITIDSNFDIKGGVDIPNFAVSIGAAIGFSNFVKFEIEDVQGKVLARDLKLELIDLITQAKEEDRKYYRKTLKKLFFIDKLSYAGKVSFEIKATSQAKLEVALTQAKVVNPNVSFSSSGEAKVTFPGSMEIPFAVDIEPFKDFID
jgi:hypothetical protein